MSKEFKDAYMKSVNDVEPSREFLDSLVLRLKEEEAKNNAAQERIKPEKKKTARIICLVMGAAAAASIFIVSNNIGKQNISDNNSTVIEENFGIDNSNSSHNIVSNSISTNQCLKDCKQEDFTHVLAEMINSGELDYAKKSDSNIFTDAETLEQNEVSELTVKLSDAEKCSDKGSGNEEHYMLCFKNGDIIKIVVSENGVISSNSCPDINFR